MLTACDASLERLGTDRIDLYLLHWRGGTPLTETSRRSRCSATTAGLIISASANFDLADMDELRATAGGEHVQTN